MNRRFHLVFSLNWLQLRQTRILRIFPRSLQLRSVSDRPGTFHYDNKSRKTRHVKALLLPIATLRVRMRVRFRRRRATAAERRQNRRGPLARLAHGRTACRAGTH